MQRRHFFALAGGTLVSTMVGPAFAQPKFPTHPIDADDPFIKAMHARRIGVHTFLDGVELKDVSSCCISQGWVVYALRDEDGDIYVDPVHQDRVAMEKRFGRVTLKLGSFEEAR